MWDRLARLDQIIRLLQWHQIRYTIRYASTLPVKCLRSFPTQVISFFQSPTIDRTGVYVKVNTAKTGTAYDHLDSSQAVIEWSTRDQSQLAFSMSYMNHMHTTYSSATLIRDYGTIKRLAIRRAGERWPYAEDRGERGSTSSAHSSSVCSLALFLVPLSRY